MADARSGDLADAAAGERTLKRLAAVTEIVIVNLEKLTGLICDSIATHSCKMQCVIENCFDCIVYELRDSGDSVKSIGSLFYLKENYHG